MDDHQPKSMCYSARRQGAKVAQEPQDVVALAKRALAKAIDALALMPMPVNGRPATLRAAWPEWLRETALVDRVGMVAEAHPGCASARDIDFVHALFEASQALSAFDRRLVWGRALNVSWKDLSMRLRRGRSTLHLDHPRALSRFGEIIKKRLDVLDALD